MISLERGYIFVRVPKTASQSVASMLDADWDTHTSISVYEGRVNLDEYFKFTFVRNPWDRLVSAYCYLRAGGMVGNASDAELKRVLVDGVEDFREFVYRYLSGGMGVILDLVGVRPNHFLSQVYWLKDSWGRVRMDYVGRYENLGVDWGVVAGRLGFGGVLPRLNVSGHEHYSVYYTDDLVDMVGRFYAEDVGVFGYTFGGC